MGHIEARRTLSASPEALWGVVADLENWDKWFGIHERWMEQPPAQLEVGSKLVAKIVMLGMANKMEWTVAELDPPNRLALNGTGMANVKVAFVFTITPVAEGSELTVVGDFTGTLVKGALAKAIEKDGVKQLDSSLNALDELANAKS
ncbi:type II toxin-antitoxin system Rv0910 family toxin [Millisia brevis]|uniref:type II toxin-antitoxin system Rv0910 family toxin n=1 Tax=Millisia brevis TaxID=264148 RepID=UPI000829FC85|nr:SRPBCC family protein [Millisia brevis]